MFGIGTGELILILVIAMMVIGPEKMVSFAGTMGRLLAKLRAETDSVTKEFREALAVDELKKEIAQAQQEANALATEVSTLGLAGTYATPTSEAERKVAPQAPTPAASPTVANPLAAHVGELRQPPRKPEPLPNLSATAEAVELHTGALTPEDEDVTPTEIAQPVVMADSDPANGQDDGPAILPNEG